MYYISNCRYSDMKGSVYKYIILAIFYQRLHSQKLTKQKQVSIKSPIMTLILILVQQSLQVSYQRIDVLHQQLQMLRYERQCIQIYHFSNLLLALALTKTYQIEIGADQVPYYDFDSNTCIVVPLGIISKDRCITLAIVDTRI